MVAPRADSRYLWPTAAGRYIAAATQVHERAPTSFNTNNESPKTTRWLILYKVFTSLEFQSPRTVTIYTHCYLDENFWCNDDLGWQHLRYVGFVLGDDVVDKAGPRLVVTALFLETVRCWCWCCTSWRAEGGWTRRSRTVIHCSSAGEPQPNTLVHCYMPMAAGPKTTADSLPPPRLFFSNSTPITSGSPCGDWTREYLNIQGMRQGKDLNNNKNQFIS